MERLFLMFTLLNDEQKENIAMQNGFAASNMFCIFDTSLI